MFNISKEKLYNLYIIENLSAKEIAEKEGVTESVVYKKVSKYGIKKDKSKCLEKVKQNLIKKYGVENISQLDSVKEKKKKSSISKYGTDNISKSQEVKNKKKNKALEKYGVNCIFQSKEIKEKIKETCIAKYGVKNPMQNNEIKLKAQETNFKKYGTKFVAQNEDIKEKMKQTCFKKYGVSTPSKSKEVKEKIKQTNIKKYGTNYVLMAEKIKERIKETNLERYGVPFYCMTKKCKESNCGAISKINKKISRKLEDEGIKNELEYNIDKYSYDIKILDSNILIEIDPTYTHNVTNGASFRNHKKKPLEKEYHQNKTLVANQNGFRCIHVWDWDNIDKVIKILKPKEKISARKCEIKEIDIESANHFLNENHLQNTCKGQTIRLGLFYKDELVEIMTFGKPRYNKKIEYELIRLCSKSRYVVIGGTEKLFKYFIEKYEPKSIISYCDNSKFDGKIYKKIGFKLKEYGKPSKHWYDGKRHITDNLLRQRGYDQLFSTDYGKGTSNEELMKKNGFLEVYDCGQSIYVFEA